MQFAKQFQKIATKILTDHGIDMVFRDVPPPWQNTFRGMYVNSSHTFYREFYGEATQIEKRPELLVLDASAYNVIVEDMTFDMMGMSYATDAPYWPQLADNGAVIYVVYAIYRS